MNQERVTKDELTELIRLVRLTGDLIEHIEGPDGDRLRLEHKTNLERVLALFNYPLIQEALNQD